MYHAACAAGTATSSNTAAPVQNAASPPAPAVIVHLEHIQRTAHAIAGASLSAFGPSGARAPLPGTAATLAHAALQEPSDKNAPASRDSPLSNSADVRPFPERPASTPAEGPAWRSPAHRYRPEALFGIHAGPLPALHSQLMESQAFGITSGIAPPGLFGHYPPISEPSMHAGPPHAAPMHAGRAGHTHLLFNPPLPEGSQPIRHTARPLHQQRRAPSGHAVPAEQGAQLAAREPAPPVPQHPDEASAADAAAAAALPPRPRPLSASAAAPQRAAAPPGDSSAAAPQPAHILAPFAQPKAIPRSFGGAPGAARAAERPPPAALQPGVRFQAPPESCAPAAVDFQAPSWLQLPARARWEAAGSCAAWGEPGADARPASPEKSREMHPALDACLGGPAPAACGAHRYEMRLDEGSAALTSCGWTHAMRVSVANPQKGFRNGCASSPCPCCGRSLWIVPPPGCLACPQQGVHNGSACRIAASTAMRSVACMRSGRKSVPCFAAVIPCICRGHR